MLQVIREAGGLQGGVVGYMRVRLRHKRCRARHAKVFESVAIVCDAARVALWRQAAGKGAQEGRLAAGRRAQQQRQPALHGNAGHNHSSLQRHIWPLMLGCCVVQLASSGRRLSAQRSRLGGLAGDERALACTLCKSDQRMFSTVCMQTTCIVKMHERGLMQLKSAGAHRLQSTAEVVQDGQLLTLGSLARHSLQAT